MRCVWAAVCAAALALCAGPARAQEPAREVRALLVSDVHFEPFWDPEKAPMLAATPTSGWRAILESPASPDREARFAALMKSCYGRGQDTPYPLFASALGAMQPHAAGAHFITLSGDLVAHEFDCKYKTLFPQAKAGDYRSFVEKTIAFVVSELQRVAPGVPIYAALGNNDSDCGDYQLDAGGPFLRDLSRLFTSEIPQRQRAEALTAFRAGGYYSAMLPAAVRNTRLVVLNDVFLSPKHRNCGGQPDEAPGETELDWLKEQLDRARAAKENVWVMGHIPPGVDAYTTLAHMGLKCNARPPVMFLANDKLAEELEDAGEEIRLGIFAHAHTDEIKLLQAEGPVEAGSAVAVKMVPSISPINGNDPAFTVARVNAETGEMADYKVFATSDQSGAGEWRELYDFDRTYRQRAFNAAAVRQVLEEFSTNHRGEASQSYMRNFLTGKPDIFLPVVWAPYVCTLSHTSASGYESCACPAAGQ